MTGSKRKFPDASTASDCCLQALYRRACAHQALGQLPEALRDAQASQELYTASNRWIASTCFCRGQRLLRHEFFRLGQAECYLPYARQVVGDCLCEHLISSTWTAAVWLMGI